MGLYPASVHVDQIYRTRANRRYCKEKGIRLSGPPLGKPIREAALRKEQQRRRRQDEIDRIAVEGKFGQGKRRFSLARIMTKLARTSEVAITITFMVMNLEKILSAIVFLLRVWPWLPRCRQSSSPRETTRTPNIVAAAA